MTTATQTTEFTPTALVSLARRYAHRCLSSFVFDIRCEDSVVLVSLVGSALPSDTEALGAAASALDRYVSSYLLYDCDISFYGTSIFHEALTTPCYTA